MPIKTTRPTHTAPRKPNRQADIDALTERLRRKVLDDFIRECPPDLQDRINIELRRRSHIGGVGGE